jgi:hypothetical protein
MKSTLITSAAVFFLLVTTPTVLGGPRPARASSPVQCTLYSLLGTRTPGRIDPRLRLLRRHLMRPPFSAFKKLTLLNTKVLPPLKRQEVLLPNGKILRLIFLERLLGLRTRPLLRFQFVISPPRQPSPAALFSIPSGGVFLAEGGGHEEGTLIVGIICRIR